MERIKFYSSHDWSSGVMLKKIEELIMGGSVYEVKEINDAIEAYNIMRFIDEDMTLPNWNDDFESKYRNHKKILAPMVGRFYSNINNDNILEIIKSLELKYREDFFFLFSKFNLHDRIYWSTLAEALNQKLIYVSLLLRNEKITNKYAMEIREVILTEPENAELLLHNSTANLSDHTIKYIFPRTINNEDIHNLFVDYIDSPHPNINYLRHIKNYRNGSSFYDISKELQYKAQLRIADLESEIFIAKGGGFESFIEIAFQKIDKMKIEDINGLNFKFTYNTDWIVEHKHPQIILGNFISLFEYMNQYYQINLYSKPNEGSIIERAVSPYLVSDYDTNSVFIIKNMIADLQILAYSKKLRDYNIELEDILEWYYREYLLRKYGIASFQISLLKNHNDYYEMCKSIVPEIESVAKQYLVFIDKGVIDHQYISAVNPTVTYQILPSKTRLKYAYAGSQEITNIINILFSPQSLLTYIPKYVTAEKHCADLILKKKPSINDFEQYQIQSIRYLIDKHILEVSEINGELSFQNNHKILLLRTLFDYGFLNIQNYPSDYKDIIGSMISEGELITEDRLLSKQEASYFNYYLNSSEFGNSKDLRNKYSHGSSGDRGEINERDYYDLLKILVLLTLKIDSDIQLSKN